MVTCEPTDMIFTALADCPACRVQGAVVEAWDSSVPGAPLSSRCRMCTRELEAGTVVKEAAQLAQLKDVENALSRWAKEEGFTSTKDFVGSAFVLGDLAKVHAALILGEPVETSFDVMGFLFSHMGGAAPGVDDEPVPPAVERVAPAEALVPMQDRAFHQRNELLALAAVAAADGNVVDVERAFLDGLAEARGLPALGDDEIRVWRPDEVGPVGGLLDRERVLERMVECAFVDVPENDLDESEVRVIRAFARSWGVDPARVDAWLRAWHDDSGTVLQKLMRRAARHLFPEV